ncbi:hypothetical protein BDR04DRAFT_1234763 [Suillus decipiens]|nr:hypothetical protein BDR04DRAFT_1234763 [Suillus decipiens]
MHLCLLPPEILLEIFSVCDFYSKLPICCCATLASLARTCRTFKEPALDILWKRIEGFKPLIACIPEHVTKTDIRGRVALKRPLLNEEWRLIIRYTQRIRFLRVVTTHLDRIDNQVIQAFISAPSPTPLLPNLHSLSWRDDRECFFPLLRTFFGSTITSVVLGFTATAPSFSKSALVTSLAVHCPSIREFRCEYAGESQESSDAICKVLCSLRELFRLGIGVLSAQTLLCLASLSSLKYLSLDLRMYNINHTRSGSTPIYSSQLEEVDITAPSLSVLTHCLRNIRFLSCRSLNLCIDFDDSPLYDPVGFQDLLASFSECFPPAIEKFRCDFMSAYDSHIEEDALADPSFALGFAVITPMLSFSHLKIIDLDWICNSAIDDTSLKTMAQSWPQLEHFLFGCGAPWLVPPSLTLIGLAHLIHHCPLLCNIDMSFNACPVDVNSAPFSNTNPNEKIWKIFVGISPIVDPVAVACQLHKLMPELTTVGFCDLCFAVPPPFKGFNEDWSRVSDILEVITTNAGIVGAEAAAQQYMLAPRRRRVRDTYLT